ncbi:MAG TPA: SUMF1/EgtB/PvdO family nonheme iron enzyme, partial [Gemmataceae bacterium]|nr:SUMF1/EgtB/PvdO family nonheme iron enzyme [Gemmataceae bacterium]
FATRWVPGGSLPTAQQWDKAAGRWVRGQEGPYQGKWAELRKGTGKIAIDRKPLPVNDDQPIEEGMGPLKVGQAEADISPFGTHDMSGNGLEWTRNTSEGFYRGGELPASTSVKMRGRYFTAETPLRFADVEKGFVPSLFGMDPVDEVGFRVVIEP